jgi:hypothetical protein
MVTDENAKFIRYLKELVDWEYADYVLSLEVLRDERDIAERVYQEIGRDCFDNILDFESGWAENFWALAEEDREDYREAFRAVA